MEVELKYIAVPEKVKTWKKIKKFFEEYDYEISVLDINDSPVSPDASISVDMWSVDFYGESFKRFIDLLPEISGLSFRCSDHDSVIMKITLNGLWREVGSDE